MILRTAVLGWHSCLCPPAGAGHKSHELARRSPVTWAPPSFSSCCNVEKRCQEHGVQPQYHLCTIILIKIDQHVLHGCVCNWCVWINWISLPLKSQFGHSQLVVICCPCLQIAAQPHWSVANLQAKKKHDHFCLDNSGVHSMSKDIGMHFCKYALDLAPGPPTVTTIWPHKNCTRKSTQLGCLGDLVNLAKYFPYCRSQTRKQELQSWSKNKSFLLVSDWPTRERCNLSKKIRYCMFWFQTGEMGALKAE